MSDTTTPAPTTQPAPPPAVRFHGQYIKDFSFEVPQAPEIFLELRNKGPEIPVSLDCDLRELGQPGHYEVMVSVHAKANAGGKTVFILELVYAAYVEINLEQVPAEHQKPLLLVEVPRLMFPFVRQLISETTVAGGFPPLLLQMVDFSDLYRRKFAGRAAAPADETPPTVN